jgi:hypothetical protein
MASRYLDERLRARAPLDDARYLRWICVIGLAFATGKGFALFLDQLDPVRPQ